MQDLKSRAFRRERSNPSRGIMRKIEEVLDMYYTESFKEWSGETLAKQEGLKRVPICKIIQTPLFAKKEIVIEYAFVEEYSGITKLYVES